MKRLLVGSAVLLPLVLLTALVATREGGSPSSTTTATQLPITSTTTVPSSSTSSSTTTVTAPPSTTTADSPTAVVVWSADMETGNLFSWGGFSTSAPGESSTDYGITRELAHSGEYSLFMTLIDSVEGTGVRARVDKNLARGPQNLPNDAYYSAWFYIPEHVTLANEDNWNLFQWKQTCQKNGSTSRCALESTKLVDLGDRYGFRLKSRTDDQGNWASSNNITLAESLNVTVRAGEWFHVETRRVYDDGLNGQITTWVNGQLIWDVTGIRTEHTGTNWDWTVAGWRRQFTVNNYNTGEQTPDTHTLYVDDVVIALK